MENPIDKSCVILTAGDLFSRRRWEAEHPAGHIIVIETERYSDGVCGELPDNGPRPEGVPPRYVGIADSDVEIPGGRGARSKRSFEFEIPAGSLVEAANKYHELAPAAILFDEVKHVEWLRARADEIRKGMIMGAAGMRAPNGHPRGN